MTPTAPDPQMTVVLLFIAALVATVARRFKLPLTAGLLLSGFALAFFPRVSQSVGLDPKTLMNVLLPPLIFEGALNIRWADMRRDLKILSLLATVGILIGCAVVAVTMHLAAAWPWQSALLFGALVAATDPIAVLASFKEAGIGGRERLLLEAESLMNDGSAVILFTLLESCFVLGTSHPLGTVQLLGIFGRVIGGSIAIGIGVGWLMTLIAGASSEPLSEMTLTVVAAYGSYYAAEHIHGTGILASLCAGLVMGNVALFGGRYISQEGREAAEHLWEFAAFVANSLVFLLMGLYLGHPHGAVSLVVAAFAVIAGLLGRAATVYLTCLATHASSRNVPMILQHLLFWGGQRGGLSLVLALGLVEGGWGHANEITTATIAVVAFSVLIQGTTFTRFLKATPMSS